MLRLTIRNLVAHKARFAMTTFAVVLGVSFVVASFVLSDGLRSTFGDLSEDIAGGVDLEVRPVSDFGEPIPLDEGLVATINSLDGVANAAAFVEAEENSIQPIKTDGTTIDTFGPPQLMFSWTDDSDLGSFTVVDGRAPSAPAEFTMDLDAAANNDFVIGNTYDLVTPQGLAEDWNLVGTTSFGPDNDTVGATLMHVSLDQAQSLFGEDGMVDGVLIRVDEGVDPAAVAPVIQNVIPASGAEIADNATITAEQQAEFDEGINIIGNFLLGFAIVSLFVSIFIIYNTFSIVLGQRVREMGLLRALGTDSTQIRRSVLGEALIVGVVAALLGLIGGVGLASALEALFSALGADLPDAPTILAARTVLIALGLGVGVTVVSALSPARTAASIPPIAALRDGVQLGRQAAKTRMLVGGSLLVGGIALGAVGLFVGAGSTLNTVLMLGAAAVAVFIGVTMTSPILARPVARTLGRPLSTIFGTPGHLARQNAARNPRRTATTGAALMIGLSLVSAVMIVGESVKTRLGDIFDEAVTADYAIFDESGAGFAPQLADELEATDEFALVNGFRYEEALVDADVRELVAGDVATIDQQFNLDVQTGSVPTGAATDSVLVPVDIAEEMAVVAGDTISVEFVSGETFELTVAATFSETTIFEEIVVPSAVFDAAGVDPAIEWVGANLADSVSTGDAAPIIALLENQYPHLSINTSAEFLEQLKGQIDSALTVVNALLALAIVIALIGIANTLALSMHERTRELGLMRAVGMTRRQLRRMVRWEAALVALFGALLGVTVGLGFGWALVTALPSDFADTLTVPVVRIAALVAIATAAGLVAAALPARRAGRLDVLDAISH